MLKFIDTLLAGVCSFLATVLPDSPFASLMQPIEAVGLGLSWLNWFFPVGDCLTMMLVWLGLLIIWAAADFTFGNILNVVKKLVGA